MRLGFRAITTTAAAGLLVLAAASAVSATPVGDGCPTAAARISVAYLESIGPYQVPASIDDPANGGNGDGYVCAFALPQAISDAWVGGEFTIYQFLENNRASGLNR